MGLEPNWFKLSRINPSLGKNQEFGHGPPQGNH